ncbi:unnamed protein product, partial [Staurois parvus]
KIHKFRLKYILLYVFGRIKISVSVYQFVFLKGIASTDDGTGICTAMTLYQGWTDHLETQALPEGPGCPWYLFHRLF